MPQSNSGATLLNDVADKDVCMDADADVAAAHPHLQLAVPSLSCPLRRGGHQRLCWLPYPQNHITGNAPYGTGNATHAGAVIFKGALPVQVLQKQGDHTRKCTLPVLLRNTMYNTGNVSFLMTLLV